jgi:hypothetical protein
MFDPLLRSSARAALALAALLQLTACDQWALFITSDGVLSISIVNDGIAGRNRFRVRVQQADGSAQVLEVPPSGTLSLPGAMTGPVELTLLVPEDCQVSDPNPRVVSVSTGESVNAAFDVNCGIP